MARTDNFVASASCRCDSPFCSRAMRSRAAGSSGRWAADASTVGRWVFARTAFLFREADIFLRIARSGVKGKTHLNDLPVNKLREVLLSRYRYEGPHRGRADRAGFRHADH